MFIDAPAAGLKAQGVLLYRLELTTALSAIWSQHSALRRWLSGEDIFMNARAPNADTPLLWNEKRRAEARRF